LLIVCQGHDTAALLARIQQLVVKTLLPVAPHLAHTYFMATSRSSGGRGSRCFELLGFDVLLDDQLQCWLVEVGTCPLRESRLPNLTHSPVRYSYAKVANRDIRVWHGATENGP
jgi:hypothetical protein